MLHHPSCPYSRELPPCAFACQMMQPGQTMQYIQSAQAIQPDCTRVYSSPGLLTTSKTAPTLLISGDGTVQTTQLIRQRIARATDHLDHLSRLYDERADRRVRFESGSRRSYRGDSISANGTCDIQYERDRTRTRTAAIAPPDSQLQIQAPPSTDPPVLRSILRPVAKIVKDLKPNQQLVPVQPTVYIVTFSADVVLTRRKNVARLLDSQLPDRDPPIPHLYTIDARDYNPPSARVCERYSGISPVVQDIVMQDRRARHAVKHAVQELIAFGLKERQKVGGKREVSMSVCCHIGTHRSVAIGERIAQGVKAEVGRLGLEEGVRVVVRHVHRIKGAGDPF